MEHHLAVALRVLAAGRTPAVACRLFEMAANYAICARQASALRLPFTAELREAWLTAEGVAWINVFLPHRVFSSLEDVFWIIWHVNTLNGDAPDGSAVVVCVLFYYLALHFWAIGEVTREERAWGSALLYLALVWAV